MGGLIQVNSLDEAVYNIASFKEWWGGVISFRNNMQIERMQVNRVYLAFIGDSQMHLQL